MLNDDLTRLTCDAIATRSESSLPMGPCISLTCAVPSVSSKRQRALGGRTRLRDGARQGAQSQRVTHGVTPVHTTHLCIAWRFFRFKL